MRAQKKDQADSSPLTGRPEVTSHLRYNQHGWSALRWLISDSSGELDLRSRESNPVNTEGISNSALFWGL
ncbi:hypothetical protein MUG91_G82n61 [Manis pentadactyla]|nr:hypothetical protein MUG91_G82n61 [Manis pentadactyla]